TRAPLHPFTCSCQPLSTSADGTEDCACYNCEIRTRAKFAKFRKMREFVTGPWSFVIGVHRSPPHSALRLQPTTSIFSKISTRFSRKTRSIGKYGKYTCVFPEENAYFPMGK